jgi:estrogen-related receptor beta like 1
VQSSRKPFSRIHFVFPASNTGQQFEDFIKICSWLFTQITKDSKAFQREEYDDPNTVLNKLMLALRQIECKLSFPVQKLKIPHGEAVCQVLDFLTEKALEANSHQWKKPEYPDKNEKVDKN